MVRSAGLTYEKDTDIEVSTGARSDEIAGGVRIRGAGEGKVSVRIDEAGDDPPPFCDRLGRRLRLEGDPPVHYEDIFEFG